MSGPWPKTDPPQMELVGSTTLDIVETPGSIAASTTWVASTAVDVSLFKAIAAYGYMGTSVSLNIGFYVVDTQGNTGAFVSIRNGESAYTWAETFVNCPASKIKPAITNTSATTATIVTLAVWHCTQT